MSFTEPTVETTGSILWGGENHRPPNAAGVLEGTGHQDSEQPLRAWFAEAAKANWATPADIKRQHRNVSFLGNSRVVFNIGGNKYRLVVALKYEARITFVRFVGTPAQYDKIDSEKV